MNKIVILSAIVLHAVLFCVHAYDLVTKSKRANKGMWFLFLLLVPYISIIFYYQTMQRRRRFHL